MGITVYEVCIKDVDGNVLFEKCVNHSSLIAFITLGVQLYKMRKSSPCPSFCSIKRNLLG